MRRGHPSPVPLRRDNAPLVHSAYFAEIGTTVVTGFACVGLFSSPPEASAPCDELDTTAIAGIPIPTTESVCVLLVISPEAKPSREAMP